MWRAEPALLCWTFDHDAGTPRHGGPVAPLFGASASASGLAILGACAFEDRPYYGRLLTSLSFGGFPAERGGRLQYMASNPVGDAVLLYAMVQGPLWAEVERRGVR